MTDTVTFADPPPGTHPGAVSYGPLLNAAAVLLSCYGNVPPERAALVIGTLLGVPVSAGWIDKAAARLSAQLGRAGFDDAMTAALAGEKVLAADETPVNVLGTGPPPPAPEEEGPGKERRDPDEKEKPAVGAPHVLIVRVPPPPTAAASNPASADPGASTSAAPPSANPPGCPAPRPVPGDEDGEEPRSSPSCPGPDCCLRSINHPVLKRLNPLLERAGDLEGQFLCTPSGRTKGKAATMADALVVRAKGVCYIEMSGATIGKVSVNFLSGSAPPAASTPPSTEAADEKRRCAASCHERWFGH